MAYNPFQAFDVGRQVGKSRRSTFGMTTDKLAERDDERSDMVSKMFPVLLKEKLERSRPPDAKDKAMADYYTESANYMRGGGDSTGSDLSQVSQATGIPEADYNLKPTVTRYKGRTNVTNTPELKPPMQEAGALLLRGGRQSALGLTNNLNSMNPKIQKEMGPVLTGKIGAMKGAIGDLTLNLRSSLGDKDAANFASFKSQSDILFQNFRKFITGVQAAYPEIQMLTPDYPQPTDTPDIYTKKAMGLVEMADRIEQQVLDMESQRGFRTGDLRQGSLSTNPLIQSAYQKYGNPRADMAADASTTANQLPADQARTAIRAKIAKDPTKAKLYASRFQELYGEPYE